MRALRGIQPLYQSTLNYESYNFMGVPVIFYLEQKASGLTDLARTVTIATDSR